MNSSGKLAGHNNDKNYRTSKVNTEKEKALATKRKSAIEEILEKKLNVLKRKQAVF